ncbi:MAG: DotI/IcmL/TraM family protein [Gammaproteobacteria bacterium]|nr:DotI/IcmL/TraM family protein [Gammaproteobacteria bacterium]
MAEDELHIVHLRNDFYRDGFYKVITALLLIVAAIILLVLTSLYLFLLKPSPVTFATDNEWRILPPIPLNQPYVKTADLLQWVSETLPASLTFRFTDYAVQLKALEPYYTENGRAKLQDILTTYANLPVLLSSKLFVNAAAAGAPVIINQGLIDAKYSWWVQMPIKINYSGVDKSYTSLIVLQALVVRAPTLNNLSGIIIDNIIVTKASGDRVGANG